MPNYEKMLKRAIAENPNSSKWTGAPYEDIKRVSNTAVGKVGQTFVRELCDNLGFDCEPPYTDDGEEAYNSSWDLMIEDILFEIKTASEDVAGSYQFNHVRLHRDYDALLCLGIGPSEIRFNLWTKAEVATNRAGKLTSMEKGGASDFKLSKRRRDLLPIDVFGDRLREFLEINFREAEDRR